MLVDEAADAWRQAGGLPGVLRLALPERRVGRARRRPGPRESTSCGSGCGRRASTSTDRWSIAWPRPARSGTSTSPSASTSGRTTGPARCTTRCWSSAPRGCCSRHRKLMPTMHERRLPRRGAGDDLGWSSLPAVGRVGGLICWENRMPLARWRVYEGGPQIWLAPTADDSDGWIASMRHIAIEAGAFVVSVPQFIPATAFPDDFPLALPDGVEVFGRGGACIVSPGGEVIAGPLYDDGGDRHRRLRPPRRPARQALLRRRRPLRPSRRAGHETQLRTSPGLIAAATHLTSKGREGSAGTHPESRHSAAYRPGVRRPMRQVAASLGAFQAGKAAPTVTTGPRVRGCDHRPAH